MKLGNSVRKWRLLLVVSLVLCGMLMGSFQSLAQTGSATSSAVPSDAAPSIGDQITVDINIDVSGVDPDDNALGSYTGSLAWNTSVLAYNSHSGAPPTGFTGNVNTANVGSGSIVFNGANASGATGNTVIIQITFDVVGAGVSALDLEYSAMAAAGTFANLLGILTVTDGQVDVAAEGDSVTSSAVPSNATPAVGDQIDVEVNIDLTNVDPPNNALGSYTGSLTWDTGVIAYSSYSGAPPTGFTGNVNVDNIGSGMITFNGANASGATGNTVVIVITFDVVAGGSSVLDLEYSAMAAATTFQDLLPILTVTDGQVDVAETGDFTISATTEGSGGIFPFGDVLVVAGANQTFNFFPDPGYQVADVVVDDVSLGPLPSYEFPDVQADHTIHVIFEEIPTAVSLASLEALPGAGSITVAWETASEIDTLGFNILRSTSTDGTYSQLNDALIGSQAPGSPAGAVYGWNDEDVESGVIYYYKLEALDADGSSALYGPVQASLTPMRRLLPARPRPLPQAPALEAR
jgi:aspartate 1-decarboxylase